MKKSIIFPIFLVITYFIFLTNAVANYNTPLIEQGDTAFQNGNFQEAIVLWEKAQVSLDKEDPYKQIDILLRLTSAYQALGKYRTVFKIIQIILPLAEKTQDIARNALILSQLSDIWLSIGDEKEALLLANDSIIDARETKDSLILATVLNTQGIILATFKQYPEAMAAFEECIELAVQIDNQILATKATINRLNASIDNNSLLEIIPILDETWERIALLPPSYDKANFLISVSNQAMDLLQENKLIIHQQIVAKEIFPKAENEQDEIFLQTLLDEPGLPIADKKRILAKTYNSLSEAIKIAKQLQDNYTLSLAYGYLGTLYEAEQQYSEALIFTRKSIFFAKQGYYPHSLYRWYWQQGRIFQAQQQIEAAINAYRLASNTLKPIQELMDIGYRRLPGTFDERIKPVHYGLADLLLQQAYVTQDKDSQQSLIQEALEVAELVKVEELKNYFQDDCVLALQEQAIQLEDISAKTAILYPLPLADRLIVLVGIQGVFEQFIIPVDNEEVNETVWGLRLGLQTRPNNLFLEEASQLYDWIIRPIEKVLEANQVDTMVVVPDGKLRMIPFSTFYDGKQFLVEKYALALSPGLSLINPQPIIWQNSKILLIGLSEGVQEYPPLPSVKKELENIKALSSGIAHTKRILNQEYSIDVFRNQLKTHEYSVIHLATHGEFDSDPEKTYLLTYDSKMTMDELQNVIGLGKFRKNPLELLTLSACKTAVGDDKAALGLAGIAIKAGARSAIATLWFVDDEATSMTMTEFYRQLFQTPGLSKAKALQNAQKILIKQDHYWHPSYWAPFLLIGNWL
ncbi:MAG: CHAT domain-containing protein [Thiomargarita sp.]|nr:CHAT domain-containing protein [Thiomargarita sp.]